MDFSGVKTCYPVNSPLQKNGLAMCCRKAGNLLSSLKGLCISGSGRARESDCHFPDILKKSS